MKRIFLFLLVPFFIKGQSNYTLQKALQAAKANNLSLKAEALNIGLAEADIITAKLRPNPMLNNQSLQLTDPTYFPTGVSYESGKTRQIWWQFTKQFQLPVQRRSKIDHAKKKFDHSQQEFKEAQRNLYYEVAQKWLDAWEAKKEFETMSDAQKNADNSSKEKSSLLSSQYNLKAKAAEQDYKNELLELGLLLGTKEAIDIDMSENFAFAFSANLDSVYQAGSSQRGDILSLRSSIEENKSNIKLQKAMAWPTPELGALYNPQNTIPYVGFFGTLQIPLFSRNQGEIKRATLQKYKVEQELEIAQREQFMETVIAYNSYKANKQLLLEAETLLKESEMITEKSSPEERTEAQKEHLEIVQLYNAYRKQYYKSCIELLYVTGMINKLAE